MCSIIPFSSKPFAQKSDIQRSVSEVYVDLHFSPLSGAKVISLKTRLYISFIGYIVQFGYIFIFYFLYFLRCKNIQLDRCMSSVRSKITFIQLLRSTFNVGFFVTVLHIWSLWCTGFLVINQSLQQQSGVSDTASPTYKVQENLF